MRLPKIRVDEIGGFHVVRDDTLPGGTKRRAMYSLLGDFDEFVYASPAQGFAQVALAYACRDLGKKATIFVAKRNQLHPRTAEAASVGAKIVEIPMGFLSNVTARARTYCCPGFFNNGIRLLPFGLDCPDFIDALAKIAGGVGVNPAEVWCACGSGTLTRSLQKAWPNASHHAVVVGAAGLKADIGKASRWVAPEKYEQNAKHPPPFPSCSNYDAKVWRFIQQNADPGALFWNVAK